MVEMVTRGDRSPFSAICQTLFDHGVNIVGSCVLNQPGTVRARLDVALPTGGPVPASQKASLAQAVTERLVERARN
jgi:hypothetical protein